MRAFSTLLALGAVAASVLTGSVAQAAPVTPAANDWVEVAHTRAPAVPTPT